MSRAGCVFLWIALFGWVGSSSLCAFAQQVGEFSTRDIAGPISVDVETFPRTLEEPLGLLDFFKQRTRFGVGFDEVYSDNIFSRDNNRQEDFITYLEGQMVFVDPRGAVLYGLSHEINAFRYHKKDLNAIDHDFRAFFDYDPGGRILYRTDYQMTATNQLVLGPGKIDLFRRNADFQRVVDHAWQAKFSYALNDTDALVSQASYELFDDQSVNDSETDRKKARAALDLSHDLKPGWAVFGGLLFNKTDIPGNKLKSSKAKGVRFGVTHELTEVSDLNATLELERSESNDGGKANNVNFTGGWEYKLGPRTTVNLTYTNESRTSFAVGRRRFRSISPSMKLSYELTPLTQLDFSAGYEKQRSGGKDALTGAAATSEVSRKYDLKAGWKWQVREKAHVTLDYSFVRSKSRDTTNRVWTLGFEMEL